LGSMSWDQTRTIKAVVLEMIHIVKQYYFYKLASTPTKLPLAKVDQDHIH
jgi:hypothetical protein